MARGTKLTHLDSWWVKNFPDSLDYVKMVLDSESAPDKSLERASGRRLLAGEYKILKRNNDELSMKRIAEGIVKLLDDPDYSCDAIPIVAELGLPEAKEWFLSLTKKSIEEIRLVKTNDYINGLFCLLMYTMKHKEFTNFLKSLLDENLSVTELNRILNCIAIHNPTFIISNYKSYTEKLLELWDEKRMGRRETLFYDFLCPALDKAGLEKCLDIAGKMKTEMPKDVQLLYYNSLKHLPRFKIYIEELKKILEILD